MVVFVGKLTTKVSCKLERSPSQRSHPPRPGEPGANALEMESGWKNTDGSGRMVLEY